MDVFAALADPVRREILRRLSTGPSRVVDLAAHHPISRPAISRHLRLLGEAGLVHGQDHGRERHYVLDCAALEPVRDLLAELQPSSRQLPVPESALDALETEVRRTVRAHRTTPNTAHQKPENPQNHQESA